MSYKGPSVMPMKHNFIILHFIIFSFFRVKLKWNIGDKNFLFLRLKTILGRHQFVVSTPKKSPAKLLLTVVEMLQMPDI